MYGDKAYRQYMDERWGIDLLGQQATQKIVDAGLDSYYFWEFDKHKSHPGHMLKVVDEDENLSDFLKGSDEDEV